MIIINSDKLIQKYESVYMRRWCFCWLFCATLCAVPLLIASLTNNVLPYDLLITPVPYVIAGLLISVNLVLCKNFKKSIKPQEELYSVSFSDNYAEQIDDLTYLSDEWIICAGKCALYKNHIKNITVIQTNNTKKGITHEIVFETQSGDRISLWIAPKKSVEKIQNWLGK